MKVTEVLRGKGAKYSQQSLKGSKVWKEEEREGGGGGIARKQTSKMQIINESE